MTLKHTPFGGTKFKVPIFEVPKIWLGPKNLKMGHVILNIYHANLELEEQHTFATSGSVLPI